MRLPLLLWLAIGSVFSAPATPAAPAAESPDLKIATRFTSGRTPPSITTQYVQGDRSRIERNILGHPRVTINQCHQRQVVQLDPEARQYTSYRLNDQGRPAGSEATSRPLPQPEPAGGTLVVNIETNDTGERKKLFGYTARHVVTTQTMIPGPGAVTQGQEIVRDGWYIDLDVNAGCALRPNAAAGAAGVLFGGVAGRPLKTDKIEVHRKGAPENGFALSFTTETTSRSPSGEAFSTESISEVIELSAAPLDPALFEVPEGFQKVDRLPDYIAATAGPRPPENTWDAIKRYWTTLLR